MREERITGIISNNKSVIMKKIVSTKNAPAAVGPYSQAVEVNGTLSISGQSPLDPLTGKMVEGGIRE